MVYTLIGCRPNAFKGKDGAEINGVRLYLIPERSPNGVIGQAVEDVFVMADKLPIDFRQDKAAFIGMPVTIDYTKLGRVDQVYFERG